MADILIDGDFSDAQPISNAVFSAPFPGVNINYLLTQRYVQLLEDFAPLTISTPHPNYTDYKLVSEGEKSDAGGGLVQWVRTYARKPAQRKEYTTFPYTFIGFLGTFGVGVTSITGRPIQTKAVPCQIVFDYFLVPADYASADLIPVNASQKYYANNNPNFPTEYIYNSDVITPASTPTRTAYETLIAADAFNIVVEDSTLERWMGNFWVRTTRKVKAQ